MAKWSVALFGHEKPKYYVQNAVTGKTLYSFVEHPGEMPNGLRLHSCVGWERRAKPGDFIDAKPFDRHHTWTTHERKSFLIIVVEGPEMAHLLGLKESQWDLNSYPKYNPPSRDAFEAILMEMALKAPFSSGILEKLNRIDKGKVYAEHLLDWQDYCSRPTEYKEKRRFGMTLSDLTTIGVDVERMLDKNHFYVPDVKVEHEALFDKHKERYVHKTDGFNLIQPIKVVV